MFPLCGYTRNSVLRTFCLEYFLLYYWCCEAIPDFYVVTGSKDSSYHMPLPACILGLVA